MTRNDHISGTDRVAEVASQSTAEIVVNTCDGSPEEIAQRIVENLRDRRIIG